MNRNTKLALTTAAVIAFTACASQAQTAANAPAAKPAATAKAAATKYSVDETPIGDLLDDKGGRGVLEKYWGKDALQDPQLELARGMTLRELSQYPQSQLSEDMLKAMDTDLAKVKPAK